MKEYKLATGHGGRKWHGTELISLGMEALEPLQRTLAAAGPCVIDGCQPYGIGPYGVYAGLVGIPTADGYKIARFPQTSGFSTFPVYIVISPTTVNKAYPDGNNAIAYTEYVAQLVTTQPVTPGTYITIQSLNQGGPKFVEQLIGSQWTTPQSFSASTSQFSASISCRVNRAMKICWLSGEITATTSVADPHLAYQISGLTGDYLPQTAHDFTAEVRYHGISVELPISTQNAQKFSTINCTIDPVSGLLGRLIRPLSSYTVFFNTMYPIV